MQINAIGVFFSAFGGAMLLYVFRLAVEYRQNRERFEWAGWGDVLAQVGISLTITVITFLTLWKCIESGQAECNLIWFPYMKACTEAMILEMFIHSIGGHRCMRRRKDRKQPTEARPQARG